MLCFLLNLPTEELNELYDGLLTEFVYYLVSAEELNVNFVLRFILNLSGEGG